MNYSVTFCNVNFAKTLVGINSMDWTFRAIECKDVLEFLCKTKSPLVLCIICAVSLIPIVREGKHDADLFIGKRSSHPVSDLYYWTRTSKSQ